MDRFHRVSWSVGSSPHTRGALTWRVVSALARPDHPRIRGEHRGVKQYASRKAGSSPHTRGAPGFGAVVDPERGIIPAYAGSTRRILWTGRRWRDHPRIRGEHHPNSRGPPPGRGSSPHTRGARPLRGRAPLRRRIIPAYAGSTRLPHAGLSGRGDHPRIRGEHIDLRAAEDTTKGSSPHTRGAPRRILWTGRRWRDHPRIRGEHIQDTPLTNVTPGSSPHTRGALDINLANTRNPRIIPAYAGSTLGNPCNTKDRRRDYTSFPLPVTHPSGGGGS